MKRIRNINQLQAEQMKLQVKQKDLEWRMREGWHKIRHDIKPRNAVKDLAAEWIGNYMINQLTGRLLVSGGVGLFKKAVKLFS